jgi:hypothetical protein
MKQSQSLSGAEMVSEACRGRISGVQYLRLFAILMQIERCEGDIPGPFWCRACVGRWKKIWRLVAKFIAETARKNVEAEETSKIKKDFYNRFQQIGRIVDL